MLYVQSFFMHLLKLQGRMKEETNTLIELFPIKQNTFLPSEDRQVEVAKFLDAVFPAIANQQNTVAALVPWLCDVLSSQESLKAYRSDLKQFADRMERQGISALDITFDHIKFYKASLVQAKMRPGSIARKLTVLRGAYHQLAKKGLVSWEVAQGIAAVSAPPVRKNSTPALTPAQAIQLLQAIPTNSLLGLRDFALLQTFFSTGCRVSAVVGARVGDIEFDGVEHYLHVIEKRNKESRKLLLSAARPILDYVDTGGIQKDREGPLFRPLCKRAQSLERRFLSRKTVWYLVKKYCRLARIEPDRLTGPGVGIHSLRKTAINDSIRNGATLHEVREFAGHSDIRTTELYFERSTEDAEVAARKIGICLPHDQGADQSSES